MMLPDTTDVSAVVLTTGEPTTKRAIDSLLQQTLTPREIIVVRDVTPFHAALNAGAKQVKTRFFVQVDADMILDADCLATLRKSVRRTSGIVVGRLRDQLVGIVVGIKLFRAQCFSAAVFRDTISPDTDFVQEIAAAGWKTLHVGKPALAGSEDWTTVGEHCPSYTASYTFRKYLLEGRRYRYRGSIEGIRWHFSRLEQNQHPSALIAQAALAQGIFMDEVRDLLGATAKCPDPTQIDRTIMLLNGSTIRDDEHSRPLPSLDLPQPDVFRMCYQMGTQMAAADDGGSFIRTIEFLHNTRRSDHAWVAKIALCRGFTTEHPEANQIEADYQILSDFLSAGTGDMGVLSRTRQRLRDVVKALGYRRVSRAIA